jgi:hypothetical protein
MVYANVTIIDPLYLNVGFSESSTQRRHDQFNLKFRNIVNQLLIDGAVAFHVFPKPKGIQSFISFKIDRLQCEYKEKKGAVVSSMKYVFSSNQFIVDGAIKPNYQMGIFFKTINEIISYIHKQQVDFFIKKPKGYSK